MVLEFCLMLLTCIEDSILRGRSCTLIPLAPLVNICAHSAVIVLSYLKMNHRDDAPHTPRVILLGPTGSGKSVQAELLASKYGLVNGKIKRF